MGDEETVPDDEGETELHFDLIDLGNERRSEVIVISWILHV